MLRLDGGILSRADDMITIRGNNVFPSSIEAVLREFDEVAEYRITVETRRSMQHLRLEIEPAAAAETSEAVDKLLERIGNSIKDRLNFNAELLAVASGSLPRFDLKGRRFFRKDA